MSKNILVIGEHKEGKVREPLLGILTKAKEIADNVSIVLLGKDLLDNKEILGKFGVNKVYLYNDEKLEHCNPEIYKKLVGELVDEIKPNCIFALASSLGKDLMPRLAAKLGAGLANDCLDVWLENGSLIFRRPIYAGKARLNLTIKGELSLATFRLNVLEPKEQEQTNEVEVINKEINIDPTNLSHKLVEVIKGKSDKPDLTEAEIIVSGGRGVKTAEGFKELEEIADLLNPKAVVGASRTMVDAGTMPHDAQVGQTGKTVTPILYLAFGISGAIQHRAGMSGSKYIVAVNNDPEASIFEIADLGIVCDLFKLIPPLKEELKKLKE